MYTYTEMQETIQVVTKKNPDQNQDEKQLEIHGKLASSKGEYKDTPKASHGATPGIASNPGQCQHIITGKASFVDTTRNITFPVAKNPDSLKEKVDENRKYLSVKATPLQQHVISNLTPMHDDNLLILNEDQKNNIIAQREIKTCTFVIDQVFHVTIRSVIEIYLLCLKENGNLQDKHILLDSTGIPDIDNIADVTELSDFTNVMPAIIRAVHPKMEFGFAIGIALFVCLMTYTLLFPKYLFVAIIFLLIGLFLLIRVYGFRKTLMNFLEKFKTNFNSLCPESKNKSFHLKAQPIVTSNQIAGDCMIAKGRVVDFCDDIDVTGISSKRLGETFHLLMTWANWEPFAICNVFSVNSLYHTLATIFYILLIIIIIALAARS